MFARLAGGLVVMAISFHGTPAMGSVEELLLVLEETHDLHFSACGKPVHEVQLCARPRDDAAKVRDTVNARLDSLVEASDWDEGKKTSRLRLELGLRDVILTLHKKKPRLTVAFSPALPECGDDPRKLRVDDYKDDPAFEPPERIAGVGDPPYPEAARVHRADGRVDVLGTIDSEGRVVDLCLIDVTARGYGFEGAFYSVLRDWRYRPARLNGEAIAVSFTVFTKWWIP